MVGFSEIEAREKKGPCSISNLQCRAEPYEDSRSLIYLTILISIRSLENRMILRLCCLTYLHSAMLLMGSVLLLEYNHILALFVFSKRAKSVTLRCQALSLLTSWQNVRFRWALHKLHPCSAMDYINIIRFLGYNDFGTFPESRNHMLCKISQWNMLSILALLREICLPNR